jgi:hypothetical protein
VTIDGIDIKAVKIAKEFSTKQFEEDYILHIDNPTQEDLDKAEREIKIVVTFVDKEQISEDWIDGYLYGRGLKPSDRHVIYPIPKTIIGDVETYRKERIRRLEESLKAAKPFLAFMGISEEDKPKELYKNTCIVCSEQFDADHKYCGVCPKCKEAFSVVGNSTRENVENNSLDAGGDFL